MTLESDSLPPHNWEWIEQELRAPGDWVQLGIEADHLGNDELPLQVIADMLRAALDDATLRALLDDEGERT